MKPVFKQPLSDAIFVCRIEYPAGGRMSLCDAYVLPRPYIGGTNVEIRYGDLDREYVSSDASTIRALRSKTMAFDTPNYEPITSWKPIAIPAHNVLLNFVLDEAIRRGLITKECTKC